MLCVNCFENVMSEWANVFKQSRKTVIEPSGCIKHHAA